MGKGVRERLVPIGHQVRKLLWRYFSFYRPESLNPVWEFFFLTADGRPLSPDRIQTRMNAYGRKAGITEVRCSPHTLRHTAAVSFLRNGGDVFSLQRLLGHSSLLITRHYCELADLDLRQEIIKIKGKGNRERRVPFGITVRKMLWKYINQHRPQPQLPGGDYLFLTQDGRHLSNNRLRTIVKKYADRAGITGVRASPRTLRHTGCLS